MGLGSLFLAGAGTGIGQAGAAIAAERQKQEDRALKQQALDLEREKAFEDPSSYAPLFKALGLPDPTQGVNPLGPPMRAGTMAAIVPILAARTEKQAERERLARAGKALGPLVPDSEDTQTMAFQSDEEGSGMTPQTIPANPRMKAARAALESGNLNDTELKALHDYLFAKPQAITDTTTGFMDPVTGKITPVPGAGPIAPPTVGPGQALTTNYDTRGRASYSVKPHDPKPERTLSERYAEAELRFKQNPTDPQARADYEKTKLAFQNEEKLAGLRASGAADARPLPDVTAQAVATHDNILASAQLLKTFTPEEIKLYSGLINRPIQDVKQVLSGIAPGTFGEPDRRFADFKALMGRLEGTAFGEGGKQLTGIELSVIRNYTPNGREPGGAAEMLAKIKNLEAFTRLARNSRVKLAQTGRADVTPDMLDGMIRDEMQRAGLPMPGQAAPVPKGATPAANNDPLGIRR